MRDEHVLDETDAAVGAEHDVAGIAYDPHPLIECKHVIEAGIGKPLDLLKGPAIVVGPENKPAGPNNPEPPAVVGQCIQSCFARTVVDRLKLGPSLIARPRI